MSTPLRIPSLRRRTTAASAALLLGLALAACGGGGDDAGDDTSPSASGSDSAQTDAPDDDSTDDTDDTAAGVPSEAELEGLLLTAADVPDGFAVKPDDGEDDDANPFDGTCLADVGQFEDALGAEPDEEAKVEYALDTATTQAGVQSKVEAYADTAAVGAAFASFTDELQSCTSVATTTPDGLDIALDIAYDDTVDLAGAEDQLAFQVTGTIGSQGQDFPVTFDFVVAFGGQFISLVGTSTVGEDASGIDGTAKDLAIVQSDRVAALG